MKSQSPLRGAYESIWGGLASISRDAAEYRGDRGPDIVFQEAVIPLAARMAQQCGQPDTQSKGSMLGEFCAGKAVMSAADR
jgi:hypothetical protein